MYGECRIESPSTGLLSFPVFMNDTGVTANMVAATIHRFGCKMPERDGDIMSAFSQYAKKVITTYLVPITDHQVSDFNTWLGKLTNYTGARKIQLKRVAAATCNSAVGLHEAHSCNKSFIKSLEPYMCPKNARAINSYTDESKCILGPVMNAVDKSTFAQLKKYFVKGTQSKDWPARMKALFNEERVNTTDFTSMEAHHFGVYSDIIYFWVAHMLRGLSVRGSLRKFLHRLMKGNNVCKFKHITVTISERLMSGALWTSSANGMLNLLIMSFLTLTEKCRTFDPILLAKEFDSFRGLFEGDDGISEYVPLREKTISKMGLRLKPEEYDNYRIASFCKIISCQQGLIYSDPKLFLSKFFILPVKYCHAKQTTRMAYLRAKALSALYNFPQCPVISPLCHWVCAKTRGYSTDKYAAELGYLKDEQLRLAISNRVWEKSCEVTVNSRIFVAQQYDFPISEQLKFEQSLSNCLTIRYELPGHNNLDRLRVSSEFIRPANTPPVVGVPIHHPTISRILTKDLDGKLGAKPTHISARYDRIGEQIWCA